MSQDDVKPFIVPIFIPNQGCPHRCIFCDQHLITTQGSHSLTAGEVSRSLQNALRSGNPCPAEVAFYGGTFTRLPMSNMTALLSAVRPYLEDGRVHRIRISTRPDALDPERLNLLEQHGVTTVELGAQSMDVRVLRLAGRGHGPGATRQGISALRERGFQVGLQLMPGLPGDTYETFKATIDEVLQLHPDMVRLYPAVVLEGTRMADWYREGRYRPLKVEEALTWCADACQRLEGRGIRVIRMGLMASPALQEHGRILAGPWHPAFGFLVRAAIYRENLRRRLPSFAPGKRIQLKVPPRDIPLVRGHRNLGLAWLERVTGGRITAVLPDDGLPPGGIRVVEA